MPDADDLHADGTFTYAETLSYNPGVCPTCGRETMTWAFIEANDANSRERKFVRGRPSCANPQCKRNGGPEGSDSPG